MFCKYWISPWSQYLHKATIFITSCKYWLQSLAPLISVEHDRRASPFVGYLVVLPGSWWWLCRLVRLGTLGDWWLLRRKRRRRARSSARPRAGQHGAKVLSSGVA